MASPILLLLDKPGTPVSGPNLQEALLSFLFQTWGVATIQDHKSYWENK